MRGFRYLVFLGLAGSIAACSDEAVAPADLVQPHHLRTLAPQSSPQGSFTRRDVPWWGMAPEELADSVRAAAGRVMIGFKEPGADAGVDDAGNILVSAGTVAQGLALLDAVGAAAVDAFRLMPGAAATIDPSAVPTLLSNPMIDYIEPVMIGAWESQITPWNIQRVRAPEAWSHGSGSGVKLLIIDSGIDNQHLDLDPQVIQACDNSNGIDHLGHGTLVAGIAAALNNSMDVVGVAHNVQLWSSRVGETAPSTETVRCAVEFGRINDIFALNMSLSVPSSIALTDEIKGAYNEGRFLAAAAGNGGVQVYYPAKMAEVVAVGAVDQNNIRPSWSNHGDHLELTAPGVDITSTCLGGGTCTDNGTSLATPHVSAAAALFKSAHPSWSNVQIRNRLTATATDLGDDGWDPLYGYGLLNIAGAVKLFPPLNVWIDGPSDITTEDFYSWEAMPSGGDPQYSYFWEIMYDQQGTWGGLGSGKAVSFYVQASDGDFTLRVTVTSADTQQETAYIWVDNNAGGCPEIIC